MRGTPREHGYGNHRPESFERYYKRSILTEGCSCSERVLDPSNRPNEVGVIFSALLLIPAAILRVWRGVRGARAS